MTTKSMLLVIGGFSGTALFAGLTWMSPALAREVDRPPMVVEAVTGDLHIVQSLPGTCDNVDQRAAIVAGRLEIAPSEGIDVPGGKAFVLTRANVFFAPFKIERHCMTQDAVRNFTDVGVQLVRAASFTAVPTGASGVFDFTIPKDDLLFQQAFKVNGTLDSASVRPKQDVTGTIDLANATFVMRVAVGTKIHFEFGCTPFGCLVNDDYHGTLTATVGGALVFPDSDGDTVPDRSDNCQFFPNTDQGPVATPVVTAPADVTLASCADHAIGSATARDLCDARPVTLTNDAPATFAVGSNVVTWTGLDTKGRIGTSNQNVMVVDTTPPMFTSIPSDVELNDCKAADLGLPTGTDDCAGALTFTNDAPAKFLVGTTAVPWRATDVSGNQTTATATQKVNVTDTVPPTVTCVPAGPPDAFRVSVVDACTSSPVIRLGGFSLANGEVVMINETGQAGIRLVNDLTPGQVRHFQVGKGEAVITATDESGNPASALCIKK
jgi:hypothetical protein